MPLSQRYDVALLDLDGVVYVGAAAVPGVPAALRAAEAAGMRLAYVTNNAARPPAVVAAHLTELGITAQASQVITSAQAGARYLAERLPPGASVLVLGTTGLTEALTERGLRPVSTATDEIAAVIQGFSPQTDWAMLAEGAVAIGRHLPWVATNADPTLPSARGRLPGNGALVAALRHATGTQPVVTGKPEPAMHRETILRTGARHPLVVGDRLDTDIEGANRVGCASLLVFSGVTTAAELLAAPPLLRPGYLGLDASALLHAHPAVRQEQDRWVCGPWAVRLDSGQPGTADEGVRRLELRRLPEGSGAASELDGLPSPDGLDALRALAAASWASAPSTGDAGTGGATGAAAVGGPAVPGPALAGADAPSEAELARLHLA